MSKKEVINFKCVQCARRMKGKSRCGDGLYHRFCSYGDCPNYGILQADILPEVRKKKIV